MSTQGEPNVDPPNDPPVEPPKPDDPPPVDPGHDTSASATIADVERILDEKLTSKLDEFAAKLAPKGGGESGSRSIRMTEERFKNAVEQAAAKVMAAKPKVAEKPEGIEPEKTPIKFGRLTRALWGSDDK